MFKQQEPGWWTDDQLGGVCYEGKKKWRAYPLCECGPTDHPTMQAAMDWLLHHRCVKEENYDGS